MATGIKKALQEGRIRFYNNGSYSYIPSKEYMEMKKNSKKAQENEEISTLKKCISKLQNLDKAFIVAANQNKKVSHVFNGKIVLI